MILFEKLGYHRNIFYLSIGFAIIVFIGLVNHFVGYVYVFSLFYVLPISFITWFTSRPYGIAASIISVISTISVEYASVHAFSNPFVTVWNSLIRLALFIIITFLFSTVRRLSVRERELSRTDFLTEAANTRYFRELLQMEIDRLQRYGSQFSMAYIDLDNFKIMNDQFGHSVGDTILRTVVRAAKEHLRKTDVVARLGGDEFGLLLPETDEEAASAVLKKVIDALKEEINRNHWLISFSIGVVTCTSPPKTTDELITIADRLMYSVKHEGKDGIRFLTYTG